MKMPSKKTMYIAGGVVLLGVVYYFVRTAISRKKLQADVKNSEASVSVGTTAAPDAAKKQSFPASSSGGATQVPTSSLPSGSKMPGRPGAVKV